MTSSISSPGDLDARLGETLPLVAAQSADTDRSGISADIVAALQAAGLLDALEPRLRLAADRALAQACAATAWLVAELAAGAAGTRAITGAAAEGLATIARLSDGARIEKVPAGFRIDGTWRAVGGLAHADSVLLISAVDGAAALVRREDLEVEPYHYLGGLRGLTWSNVTARGVTVDASKVAPTDKVLASGVGANRLLGVLVGCAEGGYADYVRMTRARITGIGGAAVATFTQVQARLAESHADMGTVTHLYDAIVGDLDDRDAASRVMRDRAFLGRKALDAVTRLVRQMGAMGLAETNPVQRRYRDLRAIAADESFAWDAQLAQFGRRELGIEETARDAA